MKTKLTQKTFPRLTANEDEAHPKDFPRLTANEDEAHPKDFPRLTANEDEAHPRLSPDLPQMKTKLTQDFPQTYSK